MPFSSNRPLRLGRLVPTVLAGALTACSASTVMPSATAPSTSPPPTTASGPDLGWAQGLRLWWDFLFHKPAHTVPDRAIPVQALTREALLAAPDGSVYRLGHSTLLFKLQGKFWLTDPVFSERASPFSFAGPQRFHAPPIALEDLPPIEAVILSHDHYDHLDHDAILKLKDRAAHFIAPTGVGDLIVEWGVRPEQVRQLAWWQSTQVAGVQLIATPAQHFSGRSLTDRNRRLWCSWTILAPEGRIFFGADSGYFAGFKVIGEKYGPFDLTLLEAGAYDTRWAHIHMLPEQTVQAHQDLRGRWLLPIHNGTFDLAFHAWQEPFERVMQAAARQGVSVTTPLMGERVEVAQVHPGRPWWRPTEPTPSPAGVTP